MGLINRIFGNRNPTNNSGMIVQGINQYDLRFNDWNGKLYDNDIAKSAIHTNASNIAKLSPKHVRKTNDKFVLFPDPKIERMLEYPNPYMNMYDFLYKVATHREEKDNAFIYFDRDNYNLYPVSASSIEMIEYKGNLFARFRFKLGQIVTIPFQDLIIIRKHFNSNDFFGDNDKSLNLPMEIINTVDQGVVKAVKKSANLRGLLKWKQVLRPEDIKKETEKFVNDYLSINNDGGVASTDARYDYEPIKNDAYIPNKPQMDYAKERIYSYFSTNEKIIQSKFTEEEWNAYYENTIEPVAIQLSLEFTEKIFTYKERGYGNKIVFEANRLQYASNKTKVEVARLLTDIGASTLDQILEIFNMAPIGGDEGARRVQTLNMVNAKKADKYQVGDGGDDDRTDE